MSHAKEHEWSEGIVILVKKWDITGHLISETKQCVATPKQSDKCCHLFNLVRITYRSKKCFSINKNNPVHALC